ncbi:MAG: hypothetical protein GWP06_00865 [Actinobacteria bacterium]|nr:hypothetical protein [Actinomycetota bacterium]
MKINKLYLTFIILLFGAFTAYVNAGTIVDNFNRTTLGPNWTADPEYQIVSNALSNTATTQSWGYLAVYNAVVNPTEVSFRWAAGGDTEGANSGGIAIFLNSSNTDATGYFVMRRNDDIYLHPLVNGVVQRGTILDTTPGTLAKATPGDVIKVVASTSAGGHHFDFYINGTFDGRVTDANKIYGNGSVKYAGVILYGDRNNNIDDFTLRAATIDLTSPNGGEVWTVNSVHNITWSSSDFSGSVKIELSTDDGTSWAPIVSSTGNTGSYSWTIPNATSQTCLIRISDATDGIPSDVSDSNFEIEPETEEVTLLGPNGGENWIINTTQDITWYATSIVANIKIEYSTDNGATWTLITASTPNDGSYTWTVPAQVTGQALIKVSDIDGLPTDMSDDTFTISALVTLKVQDASGEPGSSGNIVNVWLNNQTNVRGVVFKLNDVPDSLTATAVVPVGRASSFDAILKDTNGAASVILVSFSGAVVPVGNGPIVQIVYDIKPDGNPTFLGYSSAMTLSETQISDANGDLVVPELVHGQFQYVLSGDVTGAGGAPDGIIDQLDIDRMVELTMGTGVPMSNFDLLAGDMDHDGDIDLFDTLQVFDIVYP